MGTVAMWSGLRIERRQSGIWPGLSALKFWAMYGSVWWLFAVGFSSALGLAKAVVLQANGPQFCIGGYPYERHLDVAFSAFWRTVFRMAENACSMRKLRLPTLSAVHGHVVGGGVALCLNTQFRWFPCSVDV